MDKRTERLSLHRAAFATRGRCASISQAAAAEAASPPALEIPAAQLPGAAGREGWQAAPAGGTEEPEQQRREGETRHRSRRPSKAPDRSGHYYGREATRRAGGSSGSLPPPGHGRPARADVELRWFSDGNEPGGPVLSTPTRVQDVVVPELTQKAAGAECTGATLASG